MQKLTRNDKLSSNSWLLLDFKLLKPLSNSSSWRTYSCKTVSEIFVNCLKSLEEVGIEHCIKSVRIRCYFGPHFSRIFSHSDRIRRDTLYLSAFSPNAGRCRKNADQNNSKYGHILRSWRCKLRPDFSKKFVESISKFILIKRVNFIYNHSFQNVIFKSFSVTNNFFYRVLRFLHILLTAI